DGFHNVLLARAIDEKEHRELSIDFGDVAFKDDLREDAANERFVLDIGEKAGVRDAVAEFDDVEVPGGKLARAPLAQVEVSEIREYSDFLEPLPLPANGTYVHARFVAYRVVACARVADQRANDGALVVVEIGFTHESGKKKRLLLRRKLPERKRYANDA